MYLAAEHRCKKVIACDAREKPLAQAQHNLALHGCTNAECRLGDGLSVLQPDEVDDIVLAGLSGITISAILAAAPAFWQPRYRFVFVPASKPEHLRRWLCEQGFALLAETPVEAAGYLYTVMHAQYTGKKIQPTPLFCVVGLTANGTPQAHAYLKKAAASLRKSGRNTLAREVEQCLQ